MSLAFFVRGSQDIHLSCETPAPRSELIIVFGKAAGEARGGPGSVPDMPYIV